MTNPILTLRVCRKSCLANYAEKPTTKSICLLSDVSSKKLLTELGKEATFVNPPTVLRLTDGLHAGPNLPVGLVD